MRPAGEISQALLQALVGLTTDAQGPTLRELAAKAQVTVDDARKTLGNMCRHGRVRIMRTRRVDYCKKPVAEYAMPVEVSAAGTQHPAAFLQSCWG